MTILQKIDTQIATGVADRLRRLQSAPSDKHGKPPEQFPLGLIQQTVTPINGVAERLLTFRQVERAARQQLQAALQPVQYGAGRQYLGPGSRQFDGQRQSIQA